MNTVILPNNEYRFEVHPNCDGKTTPVTIPRQLLTHIQVDVDPLDNGIHFTNDADPHFVCDLFRIDFVARRADEKPIWQALLNADELAALEQVFDTYGIDHAITLPWAWLCNVNNYEPVGKVHPKIYVIKVIMSDNVNILTY